MNNIISLGQHFLKDRSKKQSYEDFYLEAKDKFGFKWEVEAQNTASKAEFHIIKKLEMGQFGKGVLVQHKKTKTSHVMKMLDKEAIIQGGNLESLLKDKRFLQAGNFAFISNLMYHFKDSEKVYMVYEYKFKGDDFFTSLVRFEKLPEKICRFYAAQIVLALEYLHHVGIIYRDLVPENILVDAKGYIRMRDISQTLFCISPPPDKFNMIPLHFVQL